MTIPWSVQQSIAKRQSAIHLPVERARQFCKTKESRRPLKRQNSLHLEKPGLLHESLWVSCLFACALFVCSLACFKGPKLATLLVGDAVQLILQVSVNPSECRRIFTLAKVSERSLRAEAFSFSLKHERACTIHLVYPPSITQRRMWEIMGE